MWRKPSEGKPSSEPDNLPVSAPIASQPIDPIPASRVPSQVQAAPSAPAAVTAAAPVARATSKISSGLKINGELSGDSDLYIDGEVHGKIRLGNTRVTVGPNGRVQADIEAREIMIDGHVEGNLKASESAHFGASSRVSGSVLTPRIGIDDGARLRGKVETTPKATARGSSATAKGRESADLQPVPASAAEGE
jgi:cytoskeletal protein CcmA (bactofilin family)